MAVTVWNTYVIGVMRPPFKLSPAWVIGVPSNSKCGWHFTRVYVEYYICKRGNVNDDSVFLYHTYYIHIYSDAVMSTFLTLDKL